MTSPVVETYAGLLFGQGFSITSKDAKQQEWLNGKREGKESFEKYLCKKLYASAIEAGLTGNGVLEVYSEVDENNKPYAKIAVIPSDRWYPITSAKDPSEIVANAIIQGYKLKDDNYINRIVIYCNGYNLYLAVETENGKIKGLTDWTRYTDKLGNLPDEVKMSLENEYVYVEETGINISLCQVYASKIGRVDSPFGKPIISSSFRTQERELCVRKTQNGRVLDKNSDPLLIVPESAVERDTTGKPYVNLSGKTIDANIELASQKVAEIKSNIALNHMHTEESRQKIQNLKVDIVKAFNDMKVSNSFVEQGWGSQEQNWQKIYNDLKLGERKLDQNEDFFAKDLFHSLM